MSKFALKSGLAAAVLLATSSLVVAQGETAGRGVGPERLAGLDQRLAAIEQTFADIAKVKSPPEGDAKSVRFEAQQMEYANALLAEYDSALKQVDIASKTNGGRGALENLNRFEKTVKAHETRLKILDARAKRVIAARGAATAWLPVANVKLAWVEDRIDAAARFIIPEAHALAALKVYNACNGNGQSPICIKAIAQGLVDGNNARNIFNTCWNNATKPWKGLKQAACTAALAVRLA